MEDQPLVIKSACIFHKKTTEKCQCLNTQLNWKVG